MFFLLGIKLYFGAIARRVPGLPNVGQLSFYVLFPLVMMLLNIFVIVFSGKLPKPLVITVLIAQFCLIPLFIFFYSGGV